MVVFCYFASLHHQHLIAFDDGVHTVCDREHCAVFEILGYCLLDTRIRLQINIRSRFIQHQDFVVAENCSSKTHQLLLAHREESGSVLDSLLQSILETANVVLELDILQSTPQLPISELLKWVQVLSDRSLEYEGTLRDH